MTEPEFSIIIPTYNRAGWVVKTISSVLNQDGAVGFEVIVVDDGSTDDTEKAVSAIRDTRLRYFKTENQERGAARNYGVDKASGRYMVFIDSDDVMYSNCLSLASAFIRDNSAPEVFHVAHEVRDADNSLVETTVHYNAFNEVLIKGNPMACMNVFVRADVARQYRFNANRAMAGFEDWELWLRLAARYPIKQVKEVAGHMVNHAGRSSNNHTLADKLLKAIELLMQSVQADAEILRYYKGQLHLFRCSCYTYSALHLAINKNRALALKYLTKGLLENPGFVFEKRFVAIIKHLF